MTLLNSVILSIVVAAVVYLAVKIWALEQKVAAIKKRSKRDAAEALPTMTQQEADIAIAQQLGILGQGDSGCPLAASLFCQDQENDVRVVDMGLEDGNLDGECEAILEGENSQSVDLEVKTHETDAPEACPPETSTRVALAGDAQEAEAPRRRRVKSKPENSAGKQEAE